MARKITLETTATITINNGNYENCTFSKTVKEDVEFEKPEELIEKSKRLDNMVTSLLKAEVERGLEVFGRQRIMKINGTDTPVTVWESHIPAGKMVKTGMAE